MKGFKKFLLFLLFIALFSAIAVGLFGGFLNELAVNVRTGKGTARFLSAQSTGDTLYALGVRDGYFLAVSGAGRTREFKLEGELPEDYALDQFFAASDGSILLSLYEYDGPRVVRFGVYAAPGGTG